MGKAAKANPRKRQKGEDGAAAAAAAVGAEEQEQDMTSLAAMEEEDGAPPPAAAAAGAGGGGCAGGGTRGRGRAAGPEAAPTPAAAAAEDGGGPGSGRQRRGGRRGPGGGGTTSAAAGGEQQQQQQPAGGTAAAAAAGGGGGGKPPLAFSQHRKRFTADSDAIMEAVVKVFCIHTEPNFSLPWQRKRQYSSSSSGFMITGRRILTNAHCVDHHTQVKVKRRGSDKKFVASVLAVGTECDIAMLTVEDDAFWQGVEPVSFGGLPQLQEGVTVVGYPIGGDTMSVTSGVVSRIEVTSYIHGAAELLGIQIDAAINSGNSGGPAFNAAGQCIGIAFQSLKHEDAENIGYIIPQPVIDHFITDYERNGHYTGFPTIRAEWQKLENPDLRKALKMKAGHQGVLIRRVEPTAPEGAALKQWDILMAFDGVAIACDGTVPFRSGERIGFNYLVSQKYCKEAAHVKLLRDGKELTCDISVDAPSRLIPFHIKGAPPTYFIVAGLVFTPATVPYLRSEYGKEYDYDAPVKLLDKMMHGLPHAPGQQVVLLSQVLAAEVNIGYEDMLNTQVLSLNGTKLVNMAQLVQLVDDCSEPFLHFHLDYDQKLVLSTAHARASTKAILECHCIASDRSPDLMGDAAAAAGAAANGQQEAGAADGKAAAGSHDPGPSSKSGGRRQRG